MEKAVFTTMCMVSDGEGRVLVQNRCGTAWDGTAFPGGHVEKGESFVRAAIREVAEETGYLIENPVLCGIKQFMTGEDCRYVILLFRADRFKGSLCSSEEGEVFWVEKSRLSEYPLARDMQLMLELFDNPEKSEFYYPDRGGQGCEIL